MPRGNVHLAGDTHTASLATASAFDGTYSATYDGFVAELNTSFTTTYFSYIGGSSVDIARNLVLDSTGKVIVVGYTASSGIATAGAYDTTYSGGGTGSDYNVFVAKLDLTKSGATSEVFLTYYGTGASAGTGTLAYGVNVDGNDNIYVTGDTDSSVTTVSSAGDYIDSSLTGGTSAYLAKFNSSGTTLSYSTYFGGNALTAGSSLAVDSNNNALSLVGNTSATDLSSGSPYDSSENGGQDGFIAKFNANHAPAFVSASNFTTITEDQTTSAGNLVSSLFSSTDADTGAVKGIALYSQTPSNGTWQYSTDAGSTWTAVGTVSGSSALLLRSTDYLRFVPDAHNSDAASVSFYIWDQTSGSTGTKVDVSTRGTTTAFSTTGGTSSITVTAVNDAPVLAGSNNFTAINEDNTTSAGTLVSALIAGQVTDVDTGAATGIAVTAVDNTNGAWQYTTNGGTLWTAFGSPSATTARLLTSNASTLIRFVPNADWNGTATITYRAWDQTSGTAGSTADTSSNGGTTAFSTATASPSITVNPVNDAPVLAGSNSFTAINAGNTNSNGTLVSILIAGQDSDVDAGAATGIAVTAVVNTNGIWQYTTDGTSWTAFGTPSASTARLLTSNATTAIRFVPNAGFTGTATITYRAWDQTSGTAGSSTADVSSNGGITAFSSATASPSITVNAIDAAPVNTVPSAQTTNEDTAKVFSSGNGNQISIADSDAGGANNEVTLSVTNGTLTLAGTTGLTFTVGTGTANTTMTFRGTAAAINTALNGLSYSPTANYNGSATLTLATKDPRRCSAWTSTPACSAITPSRTPAHSAPIRAPPLATPGQSPMALLSMTVRAAMFSASPATAMSRSAGSSATRSTSRWLPG